MAFALQPRTALCQGRARDQRAARVRASATAPAAAPTKIKVTKPTLFDKPISNCGARVRYMLYAKGLEDTVEIVSPDTVGGLKCDAYTALNPQGKMPMLLFPDGTSVPESEIIVQYLVDKYPDIGPSFKLSSPEQKAKAALITRIMDLYIIPIQGCMYKKMDIAHRAESIGNIARQLDALEKLVEGSPYAVGSSFSTADAALFPTFVFFTLILPKHFGWRDVFTNRPKLHNWWTAVNQEPHAKRVIKEMTDAFEGWKTRNVFKESGVEEHVANKNYKWSH